MANKYRVVVSWHHKGSRYPMKASGSVKASSVPAALGKAYRAFCKGNPSVRLPKGAVMGFEVTNLGKVVTEGERSESLPDTPDNA